MLSTNEIVTIILAVLASLPGLIALRSQFNKDKIAERESRAAEAAAKLANQKMQIDITMSLIDPLKDQIKMLEETVDKQGEKLCRQQKQITYLRNGVTKLSVQIRDLGHDPVWSPQDTEE